jgi:UDP-glucose 4-epimerase
VVLGRVGLTGATGMLGRHMHAALQAAGAQVTAVSRSGADDSAAWDLGEWLGMAVLDELFAGVQAVVHAGAFVQPSGEVDEARMFDANVRACLNLGQWAMSRNVPLLYVSGAIVYADPCAPLQKESAPLGWSGLGGFYGFSKLLAEDVVMRLREQGLKLCVLRPTSIYGHGIGADKMAPRFLAAAARHEVIELSQPIEDRVDIVHAADVSDATVAALKYECWETLNVSSGKPVSIFELAEACVAVAGSGRIEIKGELPTNYKASVRYSLDIGRASERIHWQPRIDVRKGLTMLMHGQCLPTS